MYKVTRCDENIENLYDANENEKFEDHEINQLMIWIKDSIFNGKYNAIHIKHEHSEVPSKGPFNV
jgi:septation ring formation regulator EzrA